MKESRLYEYASPARLDVSEWTHKEGIERARQNSKISARRTRLAKMKAKKYPTAPSRGAGPSGPSAAA